MDKKYTEEQNSLCSLIKPVTPPTPSFPTFHLPQVTTRIYPKITLVPKHTNTNGKKVRIRSPTSNSGRNFGNFILWFTFGLLLPVSAIFIAWNLNVVNVSWSGGEGVNEVVPMKSSSDSCTSVICMQATARLLSRINSSQDPCDDFYGFSCGSFIAKKEIPDDGFQRSTLQEMQETLLVEIKSKIARQN